MTVRDVDRADHVGPSPDVPSVDGAQGPNDGVGTDGPAVPAPPWHAPYHRAALLLDALVLGVSVLVAELVRFGVEAAPARGTSLTYTVLGLIIAASWWLSLQFYGARDVRILGHGTEEYRRILHASVTTFGVLAIVTLLLKQDLSRGYLAVAFPLGLGLLLLVRNLLRRRLSTLRSRGHMSTNVLVIGGRRSAADIDKHLTQHPAAGFRVTGVWVPDEPEIADRWLDSPGRFVPVLGNARQLDDVLTLADAGAVIVTDTEHLGSHGLRELTWRLETLGVDLMVSPNVVDIATPRITLRNVASMPFLHLEKPQFEASARWGKAVFDKLFALAAVLALSPVFIATAIAVKVTSPGPVLYRSERIGAGGAPFEMLKFRSMVVDADQLKDELESDQDGVLFKKKHDPRVTRVGAVIRRFSIDELPQFLNVLRGDMSIVGPRPPLRCEVENYDDAAGRRLLVKQGITGLWQVSGRSDLSWEDTVRLDLDYVENWSLLRDMNIVWRTARAVFAGKGAY